MKWKSIPEFALRVVQARALESLNELCKGADTTTYFSPDSISIDTHSFYGHVNAGDKKILLDGCLERGLVENVHIKTTSNNYNGYRVKKHKAVLEEITNYAGPHKMTL